MVSILSIKTNLPQVWRHLDCLVEVTLDRVGLPGTHLVQVLEVHCPPGLGGVLLGNHHHPAAPLCRCSQRDLGQDTHFDIIVKLLLDLLLPMHWYGEGLVECAWLCILFSKQLHSRRLFHQRERLLLTTIEG